MTILHENAEGNFDPSDLKIIRQERENKSKESNEKYKAEQKKAITEYLSNLDFYYKFDLKLYKHVSNIAISKPKHLYYHWERTSYFSESDHYNSTFELSFEDFSKLYNWMNSEVKAGNYTKEQTYRNGLLFRHKKSNKRHTLELEIEHLKGREKYLANFKVILQ